MSTISAQIDALRRMADGQATYRDARAVMLQAADTIAELQKDLEFANNECEKESIEFLNMQAENATLKELVRAMWGCISHIGEYDVFYYDMAEDGCGMSCTVNGEHCCADKLYDRMRELGVVDE